MSLKLGSSDVSKVYLGSTEITKAYLGSNVVLEPAAAGFDPTLGGTLSPAHWWDFTDLTNMTLSGTSLVSLPDKGGSATPETISTANGWTFYSGAPTYDSAKGAIYFNGGQPMYKNTTWPNDMVSQGNPNTWVIIAQLDSTAGAGGTRYAVTGNRTGYEVLHQCIVTYGPGSAYRATVWNNNNGATSSTTEDFIANSNKSGANYGSFYSETDVTTEFMYAGFQSMNSSGQSYMKNSLNGLPLGGQTPTYTEGTTTNGYMAIGGSGLEVTFSRFTNLAWRGWIKHIVVYDNKELSNSELAALQATR